MASAYKICSLTHSAVDRVVSRGISYIYMLQTHLLKKMKVLILLTALKVVPAQCPQQAFTLSQNSSVLVSLSGNMLEGMQVRQLVF